MENNYDQATDSDIKQYEGIKTLTTVLKHYTDGC